MLDGALDQPADELLAVGVIDAAPPEVGERELQVVAACLRAGAVGEQLVWGGVDLAGDEPEGLVGDRRDVVGHEPQEPQGAERDGEPEAVLGPTLVEDQYTVAIRQRETGAQVLDGDAVREALKPPALRLVRIPHPQPPSRSVVDLQVLDRALAISRRRQRVAARGLELLMARELGDHHEIVAAAHQPGQARVPQRVRRQLKARAGRDHPHVAVGRAGRQPPAGAADPQRPLALAREYSSLFEPLVEDLAYKRVQRHLALHLALAEHDQQRPCGS